MNKNSPDVGAVYYNVLNKLSKRFILDGLVKSPTSALCYISQSFNVR